eukprot:1634548-Prymnesium_polylepis.2
MASGQPVAIRARRLSSTHTRAPYLCSPCHPPLRSTPQNSGIGTASPSHEASERATRKRDSSSGSDRHGVPDMRDRVRGRWRPGVGQWRPEIDRRWISTST